MFNASISGGGKVVWADLEFAGVDIDNDHFAMVITFDARPNITVIQMALPSWAISSDVES